MLARCERSPGSYQRGRQDGYSADVSVFKPGDLEDSAFGGEANIILETSDDPDGGLAGRKASMGSISASRATTGLCAGSYPSAGWA